MACSTRARAAGLALPAFMTRETVLSETWARAATSTMVCLRFKRPSRQQ